VHAVGRTGARDVVVAARTEQEAAVAEAVERCRRLGLRASVASCHPESLRHIAAVHNLTGLRLPSFPTARAPWRMTVKHAVDRVIALIALVLLGPLLLAIGLGVWLSSPGPAVFRQRRVGRDGREFEVLKFRTMFEDDGGCEFAPGEGLAPGGVEGADRRTRFGRWLRSVSLDELPQLVNVLRGDMSLVGPRPERPEFVTRFAREVSHYQDRHRMKSGITGWAQVNGLRGQTSIAARVELDNHYIRNWSLWLDLRILALTVAEIMGLRG
jgi:exopolysaccharide biosynthesis polyprenyl glycosylphosphotransferase